MSCYSQQISFRYWKGNSNSNSKFRHYNRINTFSEFHGGYISDGKFLGFRTYIFSYSEDYYQNDISLKTTPLFLTPYQGLVAKVRTGCRYFRLLRRYVSNYFFYLFTYVLTLRNDESSPLKSLLVHHVDNESNIAFVVVMFSIKIEARREHLHCILNIPLACVQRERVDVNVSGVLL